MKSEDQFVHFDGSSAYARGLGRVFQRTDLRAGLLISFASAVAHIKLGGVDLTPLQVGVSLMAHAAGTALAVGFNAIIHNTNWTGASGIRLEDTKIYDVTGAARSPNHSSEVYLAKDMFRQAAVGVPLATVLLTVLHGLTLGTEVNMAGGIAFGFMGGGYAKMANTLVRSWQIKEERITLVENLPERPVKAPTLKYAPA